MQLYGREGQRLYLTEEERKRFFNTSEQAKTKPGRTACRMIYYTGCRSIELIHIQTDHIDLVTQSVWIRSAKKRDKIHWRDIPLPASFLDELDLVHDIKKQKKDTLLWPWTVRTVHRHVTYVMGLAEISGTHASPKGLRHAFGIACVMQNVPLTNIKKWMGHASIETTSIYTLALGKEERDLAKRLWD